MPNNSRNQRQHIAVLIDGDNAQASLIDKMLVETTKYGVASVRRIYGDWTEASMNQWKNILHIHALQPIQQFRNTVGKNATDSALIIDAMDLLHSRRVDSFCIVSSDSDFTRLATRIREEGMFVIGMGRESTPTPFVRACDVFVHVENLAGSEDTVVQAPSHKNSKTAKSPAEEPQERPDPLALLGEAYQVAAQENGWALLSTMGIVLRNIRPDFDPRTYGFKQLGLLIRALPETFEFNETGRQIRLISQPKKKS